MSCNYKKCCEEVEAYQFTGTTVSIEAIKTSFPSMVCSYTDNSGVAENVVINGTEMPRNVNVNDYVVKDCRGNYISYSETIFESKYESL